MHFNTAIPHFELNPSEARRKQFDSGTSSSTVTFLRGSVSRTLADVQNDSAQLERLAAQRMLYSRAKRLLACQMVLTVLIATIWGFLVLIYPSSKSWAVYLGIAA